MRCRTWALLTGLAISGAGVDAAAATCVQRDLRGTWDIYITGNVPAVGVDGVDEVFTSWVACVLRVNANGAILAGTRCVAAVGEPRQAAINGGRLALQASCRASGQINIRAGPDVVSFRITQATLAIDKGLLVGVGFDPVGGPLVLQAVKL